MVYIPRLTFKSGINPSIITKFPNNGKYTGTQKLLLTRTRIFGDKLGGNLRSGMKQWHKTDFARFSFLQNKGIQMYNLYRDAQFLKQSDEMHDMNISANKAYKQQRKIEKEAKKAAKQANKKKK